MRGDDQPRLRAEGSPHVLDDELVGGVRDRNDGDSGVEGERESVLHPRNVVGQHPHRLGIHGEGRDLHVRETLLACEQPAEIAVPDQAALGEDLSEPLAGPHALLEGVFELLLGEEACTKDQRAERDVAHSTADRSGNVLLLDGSRRSGRSDRRRRQRSHDRSRSSGGRSRRLLVDEERSFGGCIRGHDYLFLGTSIGRLLTRQRRVDEGELLGDLRSSLGRSTLIIRRTKTIVLPIRGEVRRGHGPTPPAT